MATIRSFIPKNQESFFQFSRKDRVAVPLRPSNYTPVVIRARRMLLLTKFTIAKLKTDVFRFFDFQSRYSALKVLSCFFHRALFI